MQTFEPEPEEITQHELDSCLNFLPPRQITLIYKALHSVGVYGEASLVVEKGRLRFLIAQHSFDAHAGTPDRLFRMSNWQEDLPERLSAINLSCPSARG